MVKLNKKNITTIIYGTDAEDLFGEHLIVEDINRDGLDDILVGSGGADGVYNKRTEAGKLYTLWQK